MNGSISISIGRYIMRKLQGPAVMKIKSAQSVTIPEANLVFKAASHYLKRTPL